MTGSAKCLLVALLLNCGVEALACGDQEKHAIVLPPRDDYSLNLRDYLEEFSRADDATPTLDTITSARFADSFLKLDKITTFTSDKIKWLRFRACNPSETFRDLVFFSQYYFETLYVVQTSPSLAHPVVSNIGYGSGAPEGKSLLFLANALTLPPGESVIYLGADSAGTPSQLEFEMRPSQKFDVFIQRYVAMASAGLMAGFALAIFNAILLFGLPSLVHVYFVLTSLGFLTMQSCVLGGLGLFGVVQFVTDIRLWQLALGVGLFSAGMFFMRFFQLDVAKHRWIERLHYLGTAIMA